MYNAFALKSNHNLVVSDFEGSVQSRRKMFFFQTFAHCKKWQIGSTGARIVNVALQLWCQANIKKKT